MKEDARFKALTVSATALIIVATVTYRALEGWNWVDSLYFSVVSVTTVGFGDLVPSSDASKLFTVFYVMSGIALIAAYLQAALRRVGSRHLEKGDA